MKKLHSGDFTRQMEPVWSIFVHVKVKPPCALKNHGPWTAHTWTFIPPPCTANRSRQETKNTQVATCRLPTLSVVSWNAQISSQRGKLQNCQPVTRKYRTHRIDACKPRNTTVGQKVPQETHFSRTQCEDISIYKQKKVKSCSGNMKNESIMSNLPSRRPSAPCLCLVQE